MRGKFDPMGRALWWYNTACSHDYLSIPWSGKEISPGDIIIFAKKGEDTRGLLATTMGTEIQPVSRKVKA